MSWCMYAFTIVAQSVSSCEINGSSMLSRHITANRCLLCDIAEVASRSACQMFLELAGPMHILFFGIMRFGVGCLIPVTKVQSVSYQMFKHTSIKYSPITKLITQIKTKHRDKFIKPN